MTIALTLPDFVFAKLREQGADVGQTSAETLVCSLYREGRLTAPEAMRAVGVSSRLAFEALVAEHHATREWPDEEVAAELETLDSMRGV